MTVSPTTPDEVPIEPTIAEPTPSGTAPAPAHPTEVMGTRDTPAANETTHLPDAFRQRPPGPETADRKELSPEESFQSLGPGTQIAGYQLIDKLGQGGCGIVFSAVPVQRLPATGAEVAIKIIRPDRLTSRKAVARFEREIKALLELDHPHCVKALSAGEWQSVSYVVMELVDGVSLADVIEHSRPVAVADSCEVIRQAALGLQHLHEKLLTHRDIKPSNLMLSLQGTVRLLDLGMAGLKEADSQQERLTSLHEAMGTPDYMAPEQWQDSHGVDIRADIYSLGCTLFCLLSGRPPFGDVRSTQIFEKMDAHLHRPLPDLRLLRSEVSEELLQVLKKATAKDVRERYATPSEFAAALLPFCSASDAAKLCERTRSQIGERTDTVLKSPPAPFIETTLVTNEQTQSLPVETFAEPEPAPEPATLAERNPGRPPSPEATLDEAALFDRDQTIIERQEELELTHPGTTIRPLIKSHSKPGQPHPGRTSTDRGTVSGLHSGTFRTTIPSVIVRERSVIFDAGLQSDQSSAPEFEVIRLLGKGGMGEVYLARQSSIDRTVALKKIKPGSVNATIADRFLAEAVVTGALEHPNIIPVYDLGASSGGEYFYAMKEVRGQEWSKKIDHLSEAMNLEILLRVADAIAFAHARGVVHRDLKPDNIMLGEFGEVLVMDWGLAMPTKAFNKQGVAYVTGVAGTPNYMAPEMAQGDYDRIGPLSDVYLLGALLFRVLTGRPPHSGRSAFSCLGAASNNEIIPHERRDELMQVARKAMATSPSDRFPDAIAFQNAIREYLAHAESIRLTDFALTELSAAKQDANYRRFERALLALEEAVEMWSGNMRARSALRDGALSYAQLAFERGDYELAERQLNELIQHEPEDTSKEPSELLTRIRAAREERDGRVLRLKRARQIAASLAAAVFLTVSVAAFLINRSRQAEALAKVDATDRFRQSQAAIEQLTHISDELVDLPRLQKVRENLLNIAADYYRDLTSRPGTTPALELELARSLLRLSEVHALLSEHPEAIETARRAKESAASAARFAENQSGAADLSLRADLRTAASLTALRQFPEAATQFEQLLSALRSAGPEREPELAETLFQSGILQREAGRFGESETALREAATLYSRLKSAAQTSPKDSSRAARGEAAARSTLAQVLEVRGSFAAATQEVEQAIALWNAESSGAPDDPQCLDGLATSHVDLANVLRAAGHEPVAPYEGALPAFDQLIKARPEVPRYQYGQAVTLSGLATVLNRQEQPEQAQPLAVEAVNGFIRLATDYPQDPRYAEGEAATRIALAEILRDRGEYELAGEMLGEALRYINSIEAKDRSRSQSEQQALALALLAQVLAAQTRLDEAEQKYQEAMAAFDILMMTDGQTPRYRDRAMRLRLTYSAFLWARNDQIRANSLMDQARELGTALPDEPSWRASHAWVLLQLPNVEKRDAKLALERIEPAASAVPDSLRIQQTWLLALLRNDRTEDCRSALEKHPQRETSPGLLFIRSLLDSSSGDRAAAQKTFDQAEALRANLLSGQPFLLALKDEAQAALNRPAVGKRSASD